MEVIVAENAGFCFGVKRAIKMAFEAVDHPEGEVYSLGPIIHNPQEVERLARSGVKKVDALSQIPSGTVIFRSHGVASPEVVEEALNKGLNVVDATCPFVTNAQKYTRQLIQEGYPVVMVGDNHHPESQSVVGHAGGEVLVTESFDEIRVWLKKLAKKRIGIISQTTQTYGRFSEIVVECLKICEEVKIFNTICYATEDRQTEAQGMTQKVDVMVVVGGRNSANTTHLADICREGGVPVHHIETEAQIDPGWFVGFSKVGVTAGASTPDWIINEVVGRLKNI